MSSSSSSHYDKKQKSPSLSTKVTPKNKIFITNLNPKISNLEQKLRDMIEKFGTILNLQCRKSVNQCYSFAFVQLKESDAVSKVLELNGQEMEGRKLKIQLQKNNPQEKLKTYNMPIFNSEKPKNTGREAPSRGYEKPRRSRSKSSEQKNSRHRKHNPSPQKHKDRRRDKSDSRNKQKEKRRDKSDSRNKQKERRRQPYQGSGRLEHSDQKRNYSSNQCYTCGSSSHRSRDCPGQSKKRYEHKRNSYSRSDNSSQSRNGRKQRRRSVTRSRDKKKRRHYESSDSYSRDSNEDYRRRHSQNKHKKDNNNSSRYSRYD